MNNLQVFNNNDFGQVRVFEINNEPWFVGKDVAKALGYSETNAMTKRLDDEDFMSAKLSGMNMNSTIINESGLYDAVLGSHLSSAKKFKRWITKEVLPAIRKHGAYMTPEKIEEVLLNPDTIISLATQLKHEQEHNRVLFGKIEEDKPLVLFANSVAASEDTMLVGELAKIIKQNGTNIGQNRMFAWLRDHGYLVKRRGTDYNMPTQKSMSMELFVIKETAISHSDGHVTVNRTPKVTGKGQIYFVNKFRNSQYEKTS